MRGEEDGGGEEDDGDGDGGGEEDDGDGDGEEDGRRRRGGRRAA